MEKVNELSQCKLTLSFTDENGAAVIPSTFKYRIDDSYSGTAVKAVTTVTPSTAAHTLTITSSENAIINSAKDFERKKVSVEWYSGATLIGTADYVYEVTNKHWIPLA